MPYKDPNIKQEYNKRYYRLYKGKLLKDKKKYYWIHREKMVKYRKDRHQLLRKKVIEKLGSRCVYCGCDVPEALEINHINGGGNLEFRKKGTYRIQTQILRDKYSFPVELTCKVCNAVHYLKLKGITGFKVSYNNKGHILNQTKI